MNPPGMFSSEASGATALERKRKSRENRTGSRCAKERTDSRQRMAVYRARKKAERSVNLLKLRLSATERAAVEERSASKRHEILCDWFRSQRVKFDARIRFTREVMESFMSKLEMHQVELMVAEYEIAIITGVDVEGDAVGGGDASGPAEKGASQKQGGSIRTHGLGEANSTRARAFSDGNYQAPPITTREGGGGKLLKKSVSADSTPSQAFVGSSYQELLKDEIKHYLPSQISGDGDHAPARTPDSAGAQLLDPRLSDEEAIDFLSCFGGSLAEEGAPTDSISSNSRAFGDGNVRSMPNNDEIDRFFARSQTVEGEAFPARLPPNEEEDTGPPQVFADTLEQKIASLEAELETKVFGESNLLGTAPSPIRAETISSAPSRSIFGDEGPGPARPSETAGIHGEGIASTGGDGRNVLSGRSMDNDGAEIYGERVAPAGNYSGNAISGSSVVDDSAGVCGEGVALAAGFEAFPGRSVDRDSGSFDMESLEMSLGLEEDCEDSDVLQW